MIMELKEYQENAIEELKEVINRLLGFSDNRICVFKAPTGSGKTIMIAETLKRFVTDRIDDEKFSFIWISVRQLHHQSKDKLEEYFKDSRVLKCSNFEDLEDKKIGENEILFFNWESINKKENIYIRENEQENNLTKVIENTKEEGREIILIVDESHHTAKSERSKEIISGINPKITIEVSATPHLTGHLVEVDFNKVILDGMIKKEISINPDLDKEKIRESADELVIESALKKREQLLKLYKKENSNVNPLVLIQLPDKKAGVMDRKEDIEQILKNKFKITDENGKLAKWLSEDKTPNLANIEKNDSEVQVLIFKQAISLGWDCPRAQILVLFRDWQSIVFSIQTVGRIMRMPEWKHYENEELNRGYIYTNLSNIEIAEDIAKDYLTIYEAKRNDKIYRNILLTSIYLKRQREKTRLSGEFSEIFLDTARKSALDEKINFTPSQLINEIMIDGKIIRLDEAQIIKSDKELKIKISPKELQYRFELFIRSLCNPFAPADSSGRIRTAIYKTFEKMFKIEDWDMVQKLVLSKENHQLIADLVNKSKEKYIENVVEKLSQQREEVIDNKWEIPEKIEYNIRYKEMDYKKSIMVPPYFKEGSKPEKDFIKFLEEKNNKVIWWFKNGEEEKKWFAVKYYDENGLAHGFYVDFIVLTSDGKIGLFDTKAGRTATNGEAKQKAEALANYIERENKRGKKLWGGIVVFKDGSWRYNSSKRYDFNEENLGDDWKFLSFD